VTFSENPAKLGLPSYHTEYWDPFFAACSDTGVVICLHIGSSSSMNITAVDAPPDVAIALTPVNSQLALADLLFSGIFVRFPALQVAMSEGGIGWVPYLLERLDYVYEHHHAWTGMDLGGRLPSQVFRDHVWTCFIDDRTGLKLAEDVGLDRIMWEMDYPHSDSTWPHAPELLMKNLSALSDDQIAGITHRNAMRAFQFDPFSVRPRERCTVGALRAEADGVDVSIQSMGRRKADVDKAALGARLAAAASRGSD
jgi:predicted TIM-barrel fold metal-dependent hydrolase